MIGYLSGILISKETNTALLLAGSIGYEVTVPTPLLEKLQFNTEAELYIYTHVREDTLNLYGFESPQAKKLFMQVISVSGIGPRLGIDLLSHPIDQLKGAIINKDIAFLTATPGIGKKTAERLIIDLQNKIEETSVEHYSPLSTEENEKAIEALINLGYKRQHITSALRNKPKDITEAEDVVRYFLQGASAK